MYAKTCQTVGAHYMALFFIFAIIKLWSRDQTGTIHQKHWELLPELTWVYNAQSVIISEGVRRQLTSVSVKCVPLDTSGIQLWRKPIPLPHFEEDPYKYQTRVDPLSSFSVLIWQQIFARGFLLKSPNLFALFPVGKIYLIISPTVWNSFSYSSHS